MHGIHLYLLFDLVCAQKCHLSVMNTNRRKSVSTYWLTQNTWCHLFEFFFCVSKLTVYFQVDFILFFLPIFFFGKLCFACVRIHLLMTVLQKSQIFNYYFLKFLFCCVNMPSIKRAMERKSKKKFLFHLTVSIILSIALVI